MPKSNPLEDAKREVLAAFSARDEDVTVQKLTAFFEKAGAITNQGMMVLLHTAYRLEDHQLFSKVMDDCIAYRKTHKSRKFHLGAADPG